jgi:hypothetical protein
MARIRSCGAKRRKQASRTRITRARLAPKVSRGKMILDGLIAMDYRLFKIVAYAFK